MDVTWICIKTSEFFAVARAAAYETHTDLQKPLPEPILSCSPESMQRTVGTTVTGQGHGLLHPSCSMMHIELDIPTHEHPAQTTRCCCCTSGIHLHHGSCMEAP
eukprot:72750-Chlamydomonas_euryale.AAC.6